MMTKVIMDVRENNNSAMSVEENGELTLKNIDYVASPCDPEFVALKKEENPSYTPKICYGVYLKGSHAEEGVENPPMTTLNFESGSILTADCSCVCTNGMDEPGSQINISGGKLETTNSHAIYMPASGEINVSGGEVESINMRRGKLNISGGKVSKVKYTKEEADKIWDYINYSGLIWLGDTVAILSGSNNYIKKDGEVLEINVSGGEVENSFGTDEPFTVYCLDTSEYNQIVKFEGVSRDDIKIVTHEDIIAHKAYTPKSQTKVFIGETQIYPAE